MHRIPLYLSTRSITWDRSESECVLFNRTLNSENVQEMYNFLTIFDLETVAYYKNMYKFADEQSLLVQCLLKNKENNVVEKTLRILNTLILRAPKDSHAFAIALRIRGNFFYENFRLEDAVNDFEMYLHAQNQSIIFEELCKVNGNLAVCYYLMRQYEKTRKHIRAYKKYKGKLSPEKCLQHNCGKIEVHLSKCAPELINIEDIVPKFPEDISYTIPYLGFSNNECIPMSSSALSYETQTPGVFTNCEVPQGGVLFAEDPILQGLHIPFVQCEVCLHQSDRMYTCLECRYKTYCSLKCIEKDRAVHVIECIGYKSLTLLVLDACTLFRIFIRTSEQLHVNVFGNKALRKLVTAEEVLQKVGSIIDETNQEGKQYLKMLANKPDYTKLSEMQFATLVATTFRLTIFIDKKTPIIHTYYKRLQISSVQKLILIGGILMRLDCHLLNNTIDFEYHYPMGSFKPNYVSVKDQIGEMARVVKPVREKVINDINCFYKVSVQKDVLDRTSKYFKDECNETVAPDSLPILDHSNACNRIQRLLSTYKDNLIELFFSPEASDYVLHGELADKPTTDNTAIIMCTRIAEMSLLERCLFVQRFARLFHNHFVEYFSETSIRMNRIQQILSFLCATLTKVRHSCEPNVEVIVLENGIVLGKALRTIRKGEELFISYKAHYKHNTRTNRKKFLKRLNIECECQYCSMPEHLEPANVLQGIFCDSCEDVIITPLDGRCPKCKNNYDDLMLKYRTEMKILADAIKAKIEPNADDRELYVLHMMCFLHTNRYFLPYNEYRIRVGIQFAKFLALKNFAKQACDIMTEIRAILVKNYEKNFIWFTFYGEMLIVIKIILYYNLDENLYSVSTSCLRDLCKFGIHIIEGQKRHVLFYDTYNYECGPILRNLRLFIEWKEKIICNDLLPLADSLKKLKQHQKQHKSKLGNEIMPHLAKPK